MDVMLILAFAAGVAADMYARPKVLVVLAFLKAKLDALRKK